ncbi:MAG: hypothetical protein J6U04_02335 [Salinivirgaceae bacterium]|nr:hypothetical protein [Salinivirgaceae bacterium]
MALFRVVVKTKYFANNSLRLEPGMSVEVVTNNVQTAEGKQKIAEAFLQKYGMDVKKIGAFTHYMDIQKVS